MAVTQIALNDPVSTLVTKTNTISTNVGDAATLSTSATNLVAAINEVNAKTNNTLNDSAEINAAVRDNFQNTGGVTLGGSTIASIYADSAHITTLTNVSGTLNDITGNSLNYTTGTLGTANITTFNIDGRTLTDAKEFSIKDATGTTLLGGYLLSTDNAPGTP